MSWPIQLRFPIRPAAAFNPQVLRRIGPTDTTIGQAPTIARTKLSALPYGCGVVPASAAWAACWAFAICSGLNLFSRAGLKFAAFVLPCAAARVIHLQ